MRARGHAVVVYKRDNNEIEEFWLWQRGSLLWKAAWSEQSYREVRELIRREQPDVAHVYNTLALVSPSVYYACRDEGVPVVQTLYNHRLLCPAGTFLRDGRICEECVEHSVLRSVRHACYRDPRVQSAAVAAMVAVHQGLGTWEQKVARYMALTEFSRRKFIEGGLPAERIAVKPNFVHPDPKPKNEPGS
jgi:hypothetical protein